MRLYADNAKCSGCRACLVACSLHLFGENNPKKAALAIVPHFPAPGTFEVRERERGLLRRARRMHFVYGLRG